MSITLSAEQERARAAALSWFRNSNRVKPWFLLQGPAGSGKSQCITSITDSVGVKVCYLAPTAKSALVMRSKGCIDPRTIHSVCYKPKGLSGNKGQVGQLHKLTELPANDPRCIAIRAALVPALLKEAELLEARVKKETIELKSKGKPVPEPPRRLLALRKAIRDNVSTPQDLIDSNPLFELREDNPAREAGLIVIDECSMVSAQIFRDILSFNVPVLAQGDRFQLPPVKAQSFFKASDSDFELTEIHRQAKDSPIIHLATLAREGKRIEPGTYGNCIVTKESLQDEAMAADQILIGTHKTRWRINALCRKLKGYEGDFPQVGERLVCRHNDGKRNLLNGEQYTVTNCREGQYELTLTVDDDEGEQRGPMPAHKEYFLKKDPNPFTKHTKACMDFSASVTVHSAQGSQYPSVYVVDESNKFGADASRHRYTAYTRASGKLVVRLP